MGLASDLSKKSLASIAKSDKVGPFLSLLANADPNRMHTHFQNAEVEGGASRKRKAKTKEERKKQRELDQKGQPYKRLKFDPSSDFNTTGQLIGQKQSLKVRSANYISVEHSDIVLT